MRAVLVAPAMLGLFRGLALSQDGTASQQPNRNLTSVEEDKRILCDQTTGAEHVARARAAGRGIVALRLEEGRSVGSVVGGGACDGDTTPLGKASAAVGALLLKGEPHCSAVLVARNTILTAAHCVVGFDRHLLSFAIGPDPQAPIQRAPVYRAEPHPDYDAASLGKNDIAVVYLSRAITEVAPVTLATRALKGAEPRAALTFVGYGTAGDRPGRRRCVDIRVHDACESTFSASDSRINTCHGDSGGAAFLSSAADVTLVGVTDWGDVDCVDFGVSADVGFHRRWVNELVPYAPWPVRAARVEDSARQPSIVSVDQLITEMEAQPASTRKWEFDRLYRNRWVTWRGRITEVERQDRDVYEGDCTVNTEAGGQVSVVVSLAACPEGCSFRPGRSISFTGRLAGFDPGPLVRVEHPEVVPEAVDAACRLGDESADADLRVGLTDFAADRLEQAVAHLQAAVAKPELSGSARVCGYVRLAQARARMARQQDEAAVDAVCKALKIVPDMAPPAGLEQAFSTARQRCLPAASAAAVPGAVDVAVSVAVALKRVPDRDGIRRMLWAPTAFVGLKPFANRGPRLSVGVAAGAGIAENTTGGVVLAAAARADLLGRFGLIVGHGLRIAPNDRLRHGWGVGLTIRLWSLNSQWQ